jgi:uncharacterized NAD-dependent epimerase/dehydratase family protein
MIAEPDGNAVVYCEGAFNTPNGKTAHGLARFTKRYNVLSVVDSRYAGMDAASVLAGRARRIPILSSIDEAVDLSRETGAPASHLVVGLAPDGGRLSRSALDDVRRAIELGLNVDSGLHDFLSDNPEISALASERNVRVRDLRKPPDRKDLHFFSGVIEQVDSFKVALLGTDSAVGKRTTAWLLVEALSRAGCRAEMIGTGQTSWMQGAEYCIVLDSLVNDFVSGEIEHAVWTAWKEKNPDAIVIEGQGSLMNPAYPGGFEILAAGRPDVIVLQHAPARKDYDGFPGYPIHPLDKQIEAIELISGKPVVAVTLNHENILPGGIDAARRAVSASVGLPAFDVLADGADGLVEVLSPRMKNRASGMT